MNEELHQALKSLQQNLKDVQSANEALNGVKAKVDEDINATKKIIEAINSQVEKIDQHFNDWLNNFGKETRTAFTSYEEKAKETVFQLTSLNSELKSYIISNIDELNESNKKLYEKYEIAWDNHNQQIIQLIKSISELGKHADNLFRKLNQINFHERLDLIEVAQKSQNKILENMDGKINSIDMKSNNWQLNLQDQLNKIKGLHSKSKKDQKTQFIILVVLGLVILIFQISAFFI